MITPLNHPVGIDWMPNIIVYDLISYSNQDKNVTSGIKQL